MTDYILRLVVYLICLVISLYALDALDFQRFLKKNKVMKAQILYIVFATALAYLLAQFFTGIMYCFKDIITVSNQMR